MMKVIMRGHGLMSRVVGEVIMFFFLCFCLSFIYCCDFNYLHVCYLYIFFFGLWSKNVVSSVSVYLLEISKFK